MGLALLANDLVRHFAIPTLFWPAERGASDILPISGLVTMASFVEGVAVVVVFHFVSAAFICGLAVGLFQLGRYVRRWTRGGSRGQAGRRLCPSPLDEGEQ